MPTPHGRIWRRLRGSNDQEDGSEDDEPCLQVRYTQRRTTEIVTQRLTFCGGHEREITFCISTSFYDIYGHPSPEDTPEEPRDFEGNLVVDDINHDNIATTDVTEVDTVAWGNTKTRWVDASAVGRYLSKYDNVQLLDVKGA